MRVSRGAARVEAAGRQLIERAARTGPPKDAFGELDRAKRRGRTRAEELGHTLRKWARRPYAPNTAATTYCRTCGATCAVNLEIGTEASGAAVTVPCPKP